jgi:hypothetical protein
MRSELKTLLSLKEFAMYLGIPLWNFAQFEFQQGGPPSKRIQKKVAQPCCGATYEYSGIHNNFSRFEVSRAIHEAESLFFREADYWPAPQYITDEEHDYPGHYRVGVGNTMVDASGELKKVQLNSGYVQALGVELLAAISDNAAITKTDPDGDGVNDQFSIQVDVPDGTLAHEMRVYFTVADRNDLPRAEWEIKPLRITINPTLMPPQATLIGDAYQFVKPDLVLGFDVEPLTADQADTYVDAVEVYRCTTDTTLPGSLEFLSNGQRSSQRGNFDIWKSQKLSWVIPQIATSSTGRVAAAPYQVRVNYRAGYPRQPDGRMDTYHAQIISWLAAALLQCAPCGCGCGHDQLLDTYTKPPVLEANRATLALQRQQMETSRFGPQVGAIKAWNALRNLRAGLG